MENVLEEVAQLLLENIAVIGVVVLLTVTFMSYNITDGIIRLFYC